MLDFSEQLPVALQLAFESMLVPIWAKCNMEYLGLMVRNREVYMDPTKLNAICNWEPSTSVNVVWSFIGFCTFYQKFILNFSALTWPLHNLTRKGASFDWKKEQDDAFIKLKEIFLSTPVIYMPDTMKPFFVMTDAFLTAMRASAKQSFSHNKSLSAM